MTLFRVVLFTKPLFLCAWSPKLLWAIDVAKGPKQHTCKMRVCARACTRKCVCQRVRERERGRDRVNLTLVHRKGLRLHLCRVAAGAQAQSKRAWNACHVAVLVVDCHHALSDKEGLTKQEVSLASTVISEGRPLVVVINKLDTLSEDKKSKVGGGVCVVCVCVGLLAKGRRA